MRLRCGGVALFIGVCLCACSGSGSNSGSGNPAPAPTPPPDTSTPTVDGPVVYNDLPVHDPSVVRADDGTFYVIGSHLAMARSVDLVTWQSVADGVNNANPLFDTYATEISEGITYVGGWVGSWASDIIKLADGRWYFYYDHCATADDGLCDYPRSYLGVAVSDDIEGPYTDLGVFLWSGQTDVEIANGGYGVGSITHFDPTVQPNVIDPDAFYDKNGNLWMVYGSYSGGIFILQMDDTAGMPIPGQGYGKHLAGGNHGAIEGPYVLYSPETDYYYLFLSFGGFAANDGYNIRVARSRNPDGPYVDSEGKDMAQAAGDWNSIEPFGVKLMGGFEFAAEVGDTVPGRGYLSPGHNSAYYDADSGRYVLIHHARFPNLGEQHAIRVHEMFVNENDWLVASPHRYAPISGENVVGSADAVGLYRFINLGKDINRTPKESVYVRLNDDFSISGEFTGSYRFSGSSGTDITLTVGGVAYDGLILWQWDSLAERLTPSVTALSADGVTVWATQIEDLPTATVLQNIADDLDVPTTFSGGHLDLPTGGTHGATIAWSTSNAAVVKADGTVIRPNVGEGDGFATVTATVLLDGAETTVAFDVSVPQRSPLNRIAQYDFENDLSDSLGKTGAGEATGDRIYSAGSGTVSYAAGHDGQAVVLDGTAGIRLPDALIGNYEYSVSMWVNPAALTAYTTTFFGAIGETGNPPTADNWISLLPLHGFYGQVVLWSHSILQGVGVTFDGVSGQTLTTSTWTHLGFSVNQGLVKVFVNGQEYFSAGNVADFFTAASGIFGLGVNYWDPPFNGLIDEFKAYDAALTADEMKALDIDNTPPGQLLQIAADLLDLGDLSAVKEDIRLPHTGPFAAAIDWVSSDPVAISIQSDTGVVTRPAAGSPPAQVTLTATVTLTGMSTTRDFAATVSNLALPVPVAAYDFEDNLDDSSGNFAAGVPTGGRITDAGGIPTFEVGVVGQALVLDGSTGVALDQGILTDATYSISLWLNPASLSAYTTALFGGPNCTAGPTECTSWVSLVPAGTVDFAETFLWSGEAWYDARTGIQIPIGDWTHFVAVNDNGNVRVYLDGVERFSGTNFPDVFSGTTESGLWIGVNHWDPPYTGRIDELKFFDEAMTANEVAALYEEESAP